MIILITSIEAQLTCTSNNTENSFNIDQWIIKYQIIIEHGHVIEGRLNWTAVPNAHKIIKFINWFYAKRNTTTPQQA